MLDDFELQLPHRAENEIARPASRRTVELDGPLLRQLLDSSRELLALQRVSQNDAREVLRREARNGLEQESGPAGDRIADLEEPGLVDHDHVSRERLVDEVPLLSQ